MVRLEENNNCRAAVLVTPPEIRVAPSGDGSWTGVLIVPASADCGEWTLRQLRVADKAESQEICFVPDGDYAGFVERKAAPADRSGPILDAAGRERKGVLEGDAQATSKGLQ